MAFCLFQMHIFLRLTPPSLPPTCQSTTHFPTVHFPPTSCPPACLSPNHSSRFSGFNSPAYYNLSCSLPSVHIPPCSLSSCLLSSCFFHLFCLSLLTAPVLPVSSSPTYYSLPLLIFLLFPFLMLPVLLLIPPTCLSSCSQLLFYQSPTHKPITHFPCSLSSCSLSSCLLSVCLFHLLMFLCSLLLSYLSQLNNLLLTSSADFPLFPCPHATCPFAFSTCLSFFLLIASVFLSPTHQPITHFFCSLSFGSLSSCYLSFSLFHLLIFLCSLLLS
jgi:hypothetical protein